jgi:hypothetical protein
MLRLTISVLALVAKQDRGPCTITVSQHYRRYAELATEK